VPHDEPDAAARPDHPHRLGDRAAGITFFEYGDRVDAIVRVIFEGQRLGICLPELNQVGEPVRIGQLRGLVQQKRVDVGRGDRVGRAEAFGQQPHQRSRTTADFENGLAGARPDDINQAPEHRLVARHLRPILERGHTAEVGTARGHDGEVLCQAWDGRRPLRGREKKRQQDQRWPLALALV